MVKGIAEDLHARGLKLCTSQHAPAADQDYPYESVATYADGMVLMNYDQHSPESPPGALAAQDWFTENLQVTLRIVPREKLICGIANYGYDWSFRQQQAADGQND